MRLTLVFLPWIIALLAACAQVPRESVELSSTVGRDVTTAHGSHRELAMLLFERMRQDVNRFVDNVYAPFQIRSVMENDFRNARSENERDRQASILLAINSAFKPDASESLQRNVFEAMGLMVSTLREDIESKRKELLKPLDEQEALVLTTIDQNYSQIIYGNSIVTGYLASVVKVRDAQSEVLNQMGLDANLSDTVAKRLVTASSAVTSLVQKAERADATSATIEAALKDLKQAVSGR